MMDCIRRMFKWDWFLFGISIVSAKVETRIN
jgi:hypothetical protein